MTAALDEILRVELVLVIAAMLVGLLVAILWRPRAGGGEARTPPRNPGEWTQTTYRVELDGCEFDAKVIGIIRRALADGRIVIRDRNLGR